MVEKCLLQESLEWIDGTEAFEKEMLNKAEEHEEIIIFGAGIGGKVTFELLSRYNLDNRVVAFSDNNKDKINGRYLGKEIISPALIKQKEKLLIVICSTAYDIIFKQLVNSGIREENIYYFQPAGVSLDRNEDFLFIQKNILKFQSVYEILADEKSQKIYSCLLNYRITKSSKWLDELKQYVDKEDEQYFDKGLLKDYSFSKGFVDAGAYVGDTVERFFYHFPEYNGKYHCMEAGEIIYDKLCAKIKQSCWKNVYTYRYAVWDSAGILKFDTTTFGDGGGSRISEQGETVLCDSLDHILVGESVDFIKMDIEGAEKCALLGASELIKNNKPILAICIYHKQEDFYDIPNTIMSILKDEYIFYVRQYRYGPSETVLYAMPKSRKKEGAYYEACL